MKYLVINLLAVIISISNLFAQKIDTVHVSSDTLSNHQIFITTPWLYHPGDDSSWSEVDFDDSSWDTLNSIFFNDEISNEKWKGIGWFRRKIELDSNLINKSIAVRVYHNGASEIFWNGVLVRSFGTIGADSISEVNFQPNRIPFVINLDSTITNTLAVRYSNQKSITDKDWITKWFRSIGFSIALSDVNSSFRDVIFQSKIGSAINFGIMGLFLSLSALYFFLFIFYARRIENLYYSLFNLSTGLLFIAIYFQQAIFISLLTTMVFRALMFLSIVLIFLFYLAFLNSIFYTKMTKIFWMFLFSAIIYCGILFLYIPREIVNYFLSFYVVLSTFEGLRIIIVAIKKKKQNSWIIGGGVISFGTLIIVIFSIALLGGSEVQINGFFGLVTIVIGFFSIPVSMSVYLARDIALTNKNLENQLAMVKELSIKELEHQKRTAQLELESERERVENERKTRELAEAKNLQLSLLPSQIPDYKDYEIAVYMDTATEVGGDYYDFYVENNILTVVIGDATGHGLNAGTMVTATKSLFNNFASEPNILTSMEKISTSLKKMNFRLLSMCLAILKIENDTVRISSAGMPPVYIYRNNKREVEEILLKGMPLGRVDNFPYSLEEPMLNSGDVLMLFSDGFPELFNADNELFGFENVKTELLKTALKSPSDIINSFKNTIDAWKGNLEINDDISFVIIKKH